MLSPRLQCCLQKVKGTEGVVRIENPNLVKLKNFKARDVDESYLAKLAACLVDFLLFFGN